MTFLAVAPVLIVDLTLEYLGFVYTFFYRIYNKTKILILFVYAYILVTYFVFEVPQTFLVLAWTLRHYFKN